MKRKPFDLKSKPAKAPRTIAISYDSIRSDRWTSFEHMRIDCKRIAEVSPPLPINYLVEGANLYHAFEAFLQERLHPETVHYVRQMPGALEMVRRAFINHTHGERDFLNRQRRDSNTTTTTTLNHSNAADEAEKVTTNV